MPVFSSESGKPRHFVRALAGFVAVTPADRHRVRCDRNVPEQGFCHRLWCTYGGGLLDTPGLKMSVAPGTRGGFTTFDTQRFIPADVRDYIIDAEESVRDPGATAIVLPVRLATSRSTVKRSRLMV